MVSEGTKSALPVVWCMRDNQLVPHQVSAVRLQGAVTGAHLAAVTDFLRMVATRRLVLPPPPCAPGQPEPARKLSHQLEVPCVFLNDSANQKDLIVSEAATELKDMDSSDIPLTIEDNSEEPPKSDIRIRKMSTFALSPPRLSMDSASSDSTYANIENMIQTLEYRVEEEKFAEEDAPESPPPGPCPPPSGLRRPYMPRKKRSVCSIGSFENDDPENDVIFKSKPKSSQWLSLERIEYNPKYVNTDRLGSCGDKADFVSKWITDHSNIDEDILPELRRKSLPLKANEKFLEAEASRRHSDGLSCCKEDSASDTPTARSKWHSLVKRHLLALKSDKRLKKQRSAWARRLSGASTASTASDPCAPCASLADAYVKLTTLP